MNESDMRKRILAISADTSLTQAQKGAEIQRLMMGSAASSKPAAKEQDNSRFTKAYHSEDTEVLGCKHYPRKCKYIAACCGFVYGCRLCHDEEEDHAIDRHATKDMFCMLCAKVGPIGHNCSHCGEPMSRYYCGVCCFHDSTVGKDIYHCDLCRLCRVGKREDFFHCESCGTCLAESLREDGEHKCFENVCDTNCPICLEHLFTSTKKVTFLRCGHPIHLTCLGTNLARCPICKKTTFDSSGAETAHLDSLIGMQPMPARYRDAKAEVTCNECEQRSVVPHHFLADKCGHCGSYNTQIIQVTGMPKEGDGPDSDDDDDDNEVLVLDEDSGDEEEEEESGDPVAELLMNNPEVD